MRRSIGVGIVIAVVAVPCASGSSEPDASSDVAEHPGDTPTTTTTAAVVTTEAAAWTTTTESAPAAEQTSPSSSVADCVEGTWELEGRRFLDDLLAAGPPEAELTGAVVTCDGWWWA